MPLRNKKYDSADILARNILSNAIQEIRNIHFLSNTFWIEILAVILKISNIQTYDNFKEDMRAKIMSAVYESKEETDTVLGLCSELIVLLHDHTKKPKVTFGYEHRAIHGYLSIWGRLTN